VKYVKIASFSTIIMEAITGPSKKKDRGGFFASIPLGDWSRKYARKKSIKES